MPPTPSASGVVSTLVYDFTVDILGHLDDSTGAITHDDGQGGYDLLSRIVVTVLDRGGRRSRCVPRKSPRPSGGTAVAGLRYPLT